MLLMMIMISIAWLEGVPNGCDATDEQCWEPYEPSVTSSASSGPLQMMQCDAVRRQVGVKTDSTDRTCDTVDG